MEKTPKKPKEIDCNKCKHQCSKKFNEELRAKICESFWKLNYARQKDFILANVRTKPPKRRRPSVKGSTEIKRTNTKIFQICDKKVCQRFFLKTLAISNGPLINAFKNKSEFTNFFEGTDLRGRHTPSNKLKQEIVDSIVTYLSEKCIAETTGKFRKKIICDGTSKSLRNLFDEYKSSNDSCPSYTSFKKIFYENNFSLPQEKLKHKHKPVKSEPQQPETSPRKQETLNFESYNVFGNADTQNANVIVTQVPDTSSNFQDSAEVYEIQFVIPTSSL